ncbi:nicotinate phosphoribosyltransferase, partial [Streptococcus suis]
MYAYERFMQFEGPLSQCQFIETAILNIVKYQNLIATKSTSINAVNQDKHFITLLSLHEKE